MPSIVEKILNITQDDFSENLKYYSRYGFTFKEYRLKIQNDNERIVLRLVCGDAPNDDHIFVEGMGVYIKKSYLFGLINVYVLENYIEIRQTIKSDKNVNMMVDHVIELFRQYNVNNKDILIQNKINERNKIWNYLNMDRNS